MNSDCNNFSFDYELIEKNERKIKEIKKIVVAVTLISFMIILVLIVSLLSISDRNDLASFFDDKSANKNNNKSFNLDIQRTGNKSLICQ